MGREGEIVGEAEREGGGGRGGDGERPFAEDAGEGCGDDSVEEAAAVSEAAERTAATSAAACESVKRAARCVAKLSEQAALVDAAVATKAAAIATVSAAEVDGKALEVLKYAHAVEIAAVAGVDEGMGERSVKQMKARASALATASQAADRTMSKEKSGGADVSHVVAVAAADQQRTRPLWLSVLALRVWLA